MTRLSTLPTKTPRPRGGRKNMAEKEEGRKQGRVGSDINWTAWLAHQIMQVQETKIYRDVIVQLSSSSPAASSKWSSTDSFSNPNFAKVLVLPLQLCRMPGARSALQLATLHASSHRATSCMVPLGRCCLTPRRPFLASAAQGQNNNCSE